MNNYIKRDDALNALREYPVTKLKTAIRRLPSADVVEVVRCKDCVYRVIVRDPLMGTMDCYGCKVMHYNEDDWFCSFGERKDDD